MTSKQHMARRRKHLRIAKRARKRGAHKVAQRHRRGARRELTNARVARRREQASHARGGPSNLTAAQREHARDRAVQAAYLCLRNRGVVHYTQGGYRWQGINARYLSKKGQFPKFADCSSFLTWCYWNALQVTYNVGDVVNGLGWNAGYTGTMLNHGQRITASMMKPGDAIIYGRGFPGGHTAIYVGRGLCISHGSEAGPFLLPWNYRSDVMAIRRYI